MANALKGADTKLLSPAIRAISTNADGMARATLRGFFEKKLSLEDVQSLAPEIYDAVKIRSPSDTMFAKTQGAQGSESRTGEIMKEITKYGWATKIATFTIATACLLHRFERMIGNAIDATTSASYSVS